MVKLKFETVTPLHISNGNELAQNLHYVTEDQYVYIIDLLKTSKFLADLKVFNFSRNYSVDDIRAMINSRKAEIAEKCSKYAIEAMPTFLKHLESERRIGMTYIIEFINSNGRFYIPASSVKGALLTILHRSYLGIKEERKGDQIIHEANIKDKFVLHDSEFLPNSAFAIFRTGYGRPSINIMCLDSGEEFSLTISKLGELNIKELKSKLREYYPTQIHKALSFIKKYKSEKNNESGTNIYYDLLSELAEEKLDSNEFMINLGFGSGSWFKIFNDTNPPKFKNRKTKNEEEAHTSFIIKEGDSVDHFGWCKLKIEE